MTSSLVGSEMCIRDSPFACGTRLPRASCTCEEATPIRHPNVVFPLCPVSYTHLTLPTICSV
eukprot:9915882-Prorocentrum_lima.AAC.1